MRLITIHAYLSVNNSTALTIEYDVMTDKIRCQETGKNPERWRKLYYTEKRGPFFNRYGKRYYINEFMKP